MENTANRITLTGTLASLPEYSHQNHERKFFRFLLSVDRLSGTEDLLPVLAADMAPARRAANRMAAALAAPARGLKAARGTAACRAHRTLPGATVQLRGVRVPTEADAAISAGMR